VADIFISYARSDRDKVRTLIPLLDAQGWSVFWDPAIEPGQRWDDLIAAELENARCVIVIWSQASVLSNWVKDEATRGREREVLIPVSIDGARAPLGFRHIQIEQIEDWKSDGNAAAVQRFLGAIRRVIGAGERDQVSEAWALSDARYDFSGAPGSLAFEAAQDGSYIVDYVTECGDSWDSTAAVAHVIARPSIRSDRKTQIERGNLLVIGINDPDPRRTLDRYESTFVTPYARASGRSATRGALFAVAGYHRAERSFAHFETLFCAARSRASRGTGLAFGAWETHQRDTFFAIALPYNWWLWGVDIRFGQPLDVKQFNYFTLIAESLTAQDKVMICTPHQNWLYSDYDDWPEQGNLQKIIAIVEASPARVSAILAGGDLEYARAMASEKSLHLFETGGGRNFVHPTHWEPSNTVLRWRAPTRTEDKATKPRTRLAGVAEPRDRAAYEKALDFWVLSGRRARNARIVARMAIANLINAASRPPRELNPSAQLEERPSDGIQAQLKAVFPRRRQSVCLAFGNLGFPFRNPSLAIAVGLVYWFITWQFQTLVNQYEISAGKIDAIGISIPLWDVLLFMPLYLVQAMIVSLTLMVVLAGLFVALLAYARNGQRSLMSKIPAAAVGTAHFALHVVAMFTLSLSVIMLNNWMTPSLERALDAMYQSRQEQAPIVRDVIQESLTPLQRRIGTQQGAPVAEAARRPTPVREIVGFISYPVLMVGLGMLVGGFIWGFYLTLTSFLGRKFAQTPFAMLGTQGFRSFLRLRLEPSRLTIYPIGLRRTQMTWAQAAGHPPRAGVAPDALRPELIEPPIVIEADCSKA
jgi:TIR domain